MRVRLVALITRPRMQVLVIKWTNKRRRMPKRLRDRFGVCVPQTAPAYTDARANVLVSMTPIIARRSTPEKSPKHETGALQKKDVMPLNMLNRSISVCLSSVCLSVLSAQVHVFLPVDARMHFSQSCYRHCNHDPDCHSIWFEVTCLLRCPLTSQSDIDAARLQVEDGLRFIQRLQDITAARSKVGVLMGDIFQELLRRISRGTSTDQTFGRGIARDMGHYDAIGTLSHLLLQVISSQTGSTHEPQPARQRSQLLHYAGARLGNMAHGNRLRFSLCKISSFTTQPQRT